VKARKPQAAPRKPKAASRPPAAATYLFAVVAATTEPSASGAPAGPPGLGSLRWLRVGDGLWVAVADAPRPGYGAPAIEKGLKDLDWVSACAVAHERVVEHVSALGTAVPMKLFTLFSSDVRAVAELGRAQARMRGVMRRIEGRQEWGVRVSVDEAAARTRARERAQQAADGLSEGAGFLTRKREEHKEARDIVDLGRTAADEVFEALGRHADETQRRAPAAAEPGLRLLLDAAFLVPTKGAAAFRESVREQAERLAGHGYRVVLTGPWPAYNFVAAAR
jgi:hypothetical protein